MTLIRFSLCILLLWGVSACSNPADEVLLNYEKMLCRADSMAQAGIADSAQTAETLAELRREYSRAKELSDGGRVRIKPVNKLKQFLWGAFSVLMFSLNIWFSIRDVKFRHDRKHRRYLVDLSQNEERLRNNEREREELKACLREMSLTDEEREEVHRSLTNLMEHGNRLHEENQSLRVRLKEYEKRPMPRELDLLKKEGERARHLDERLQALSAVLVDGDKFVQQLRARPRFLLEDDWEYLQKLADRVYDDFTARLALHFPQLTFAHRQLCLLIRLRFSNAQIAALTAVSTSSVSQQKFRLKKRMMEADEALFANGEAVDTVIENC